MSKYRISGIWKNTDNVITHYAFHTVNENGSGTLRATKISKAAAIELLEKKENVATTWMWDYTQSIWAVGEDVRVVNGSNGKFLRSNPDNRKTDNLGHLIDFDWIAP